MQRLMAHGLDASPPRTPPPSPHRKHAWPTVVRPRQTAPSTPRKRACRRCLTCPHPATSESPNTCGRSRLSARARGVPAHRRDAGPDAGGKARWRRGWRKAGLWPTGPGPPGTPKRPSLGTGSKAPQNITSPGRRTWCGSCCRSPSWANRRAACCRCWSLLIRSLPLLEVTPPRDGVK